jgi:hypothetical protein
MATRVKVEARVVRGMVETHPRMRTMREALETRYGATEEESLAFAEDLLGSAVQRFGLKYSDAMTERLAHLFDLRDQASMVVEEVIGQQQLTPEAAGAKLGQLFTGMKEDMAAITDPAKFAQKSNLKADLDISKDVDRAFADYEKNAPQKPKRALRTGRHAEQTKVLRQKFDVLPAARRKAMRKAAELRPRDLWKAVSSESESALNTNIQALRAKAEASGMRPAEIDALEQGVRDMSLERARSQRLPGTAEGVARAEGLSKLNPELRKIVAGDRSLELLAAENPEMIAEFAKASGAKSRSALRRYIRQRMVTHIKGLAGEFTTAFDLGDRMIFLKGPDYDVTIPGTDLVGVTKDGRVWLIDNKALTAKELDSVSSLTRNLPKNIGDDAAAFNDKFGMGRDPHIGDSVSRLSKATKEIRDVTKGLDQKAVASKAIQDKITKICNDNGIDRVVTNAGGSIEGLSQGLEKAGIRFEDLNQPEPPGEPLTGQRSYGLP